MFIFKNFIIVLITISLITVMGCGAIDGDYTQLSAPFTTESQSNVADTSQPDDSSNASSIPEQTVTVEYDKNELVRVTDFIPDARIDMKYASADNFTKGKIYNFNDAYLRYGTVMKLKKAADELRQQGYLLLIYDAFRPQSAQFTLYENAAVEDKAFVADPKKKSQHSAGKTVDISLVKTDGSAVEMPSEFDNFTKKADRDYSDVSKQAGENSKLLESALEKAGFEGYYKEWWHYSDSDSYGYDDIKNVKLLNKSQSSYTADCDEFVTLRQQPDSKSEEVCKAPKDAQLKPLSWTDKYVRVMYKNQIGYVSTGYIK